MAEHERKEDTMLSSSVEIEEKGSLLTRKETVKKARTSVESAAKQQCRPFSYTKGNAGYRLLGLSKRHHVRKYLFVLF